ncbi:hypothetical protein QBC35DRAFT_129264 [Podospora australis]|uniref:N-acetyltransferase domain-containing protein n=1 Tax=Podospora australis TaxID=1536484 RepID=A0AAN7AK91_9PEZI|nr:hypothetical protein QBC35DRAFT_129264 [Podospora australis]
MSRSQQPSIRSFFQPRSLPAYAAPPSNAPSPSQNYPNSSDGDVAASSTPESAAAALPPVAPPPVPESQKQLARTVLPKTVTGPVSLPPAIPVLPSPPSLPSGATIVPLTEQHIPALKRINALLLPVPYPDSFYAKILEPLVAGLFSRAILWQDSPSDPPKLIGGLVCRLEPNFFLDAFGNPLPTSPPPLGSNTRPGQPIVLEDTPYHAIYIQSLALLSPYRSLGLAAAALEHIIASASLLNAAGASLDPRTVYAHVWTENPDGLRWYEARGFAKDSTEPVKGYYFKLRPDTAWIVRRQIGPGTPIVTTVPPPTNTAARSPPPPPPPTSTLAAAVNLPQHYAQPPGMGSLLSTTHSSAAPSNSNGVPPPPRRSPSGGTYAGTSASTSTTSLSYQKARPEMEWNDLPAEMVMSTPTGRGSSSQLAPPPTGSGPGSGASSRSSSSVRKKKERAYPSAAFGN